jgi:hypothetical protein
MGKKAAKRGRGRPRRYAPGKRPILAFRMAESMYKDLVKGAKDNKRSLSEEIEFRLGQWAEVPRLLAQAKAARDQAHIQAIRQAGFQIVREAGGGGNVTVNVSPELLLAEADGILRSGFVAPENVDKSPTEIRMQRLIQETVEALLEKHGLIGRKGAA